MGRRQMQNDMSDALKKIPLTPSMPKSFGSCVDAIGRQRSRFRRSGPGPKQAQQRGRHRRRPPLRHSSRSRWPGRTSRTNCELAAGSKQRVSDARHEIAIKPGDRRQLGQRRVGKRSRDDESRQRHAGDQIESNAIGSAGAKSSELRVSRSPIQGMACRPRPLLRRCPRSVRHSTGTRKSIRRSPQKARTSRTRRKFCSAYRHVIPASHALFATLRLQDDNCRSEYSS